MLERIRILFFSIWLGAVVCANAGQLDQVRISTASFNPTLGEEITLSYELTRPDRVTVRVYDPDGGLVATVVDGEERDAGSHREAWNGRDWESRLVPDEAYTFTVETSSGAVYDPGTFSGGEVGDLSDARFDRDAGTVGYRLPAVSRVLIRLGVANGPMLKTLVDWKPRVVGSVTEYWNGKDEDGLIDLQNTSGFTALVTYVTLPDATAIAYGNSAASYRDTKLGRWSGRPTRPEREATPELGKRLRPEGLVPPAWARAPRVKLSFSGHEEDVPQLAGSETAVRVDVDEADRDRLQEEQFEVLFFVDHVFFAEAERGYVPLNWRWELATLPPGEHLLTVNISSFKGQVGVASRRVHIGKE
jgi:FlgD Ig-like domain